MASDRNRVVFLLKLIFDFWKQKIGKTVECKHKNKRIDGESHFVIGLWSGGYGKISNGSGEK